MPGPESGPVSGYGYGYGPPNPPPPAPGYGFYPGVGQIPTAPADQTRRPDLGLWLSVAVLEAAAAVTQVVFLFAHSEGVTRLQSNYEFGAVDAYYGIRALLFFGCAALLLARRSRRLAAGIALSLGAGSLAFYFGTLRPSVFDGRADRLALWMGAGALVFTVLAGLLTLLALVREARPARRAAAVPQVGPFAYAPPPAAVRRQQARSERVTAVVAGFAGAVLLALGRFTDTFQVTISSGGSIGDHTVRCCGWSQVGGWEQAQLAVGSAATLLLAVLAATLGARTVAAGMLAGLVLLPLSDVAQTVAVAVAPAQSIYGFDALSSNPFLRSGVAASPAAGFWLLLIGIGALAGAALARLLMGPRENPYPELAGFAS
jgi:hypothetical protein